MYLFGYCLSSFGCIPNDFNILRHRLWYFTMAPSTTSNSLEPEGSSFSVLIIARLIVHVAGHGKKKATKKTTKTKEFAHIFYATKSNYLDFLTTILTKHHISNKLQVTDHRHYACKMQVPPSK